jgi:hypothetical protein
MLCRVTLDPAQQRLGADPELPRDTCDHPVIPAPRIGSPPAVPAGRPGSGATRADDEHGILVVRSTRPPG